MLGEKHDLVHELPEYREQIHELKMNNPEFAKLYDEYHELDNEVRRIEEGIENTDDFYLEGLKKKRLQHLDALLAILKQ